MLNRTEVNQLFTAICHASDTAINGESVVSVLSVLELLATYSDCPVTNISVKLDNGKASMGWFIPERKETSSD
jgi:hypothetical protein